MLKTKEAILGLNDKKIEKVFVEPWNDEVCIRVLSGRERDAFEISFMVEKKKQGDEEIEPLMAKKAVMSNFRARLVSLCLCDEEGIPLFTEADAKLLGQKSGVALDIIATAAKKLNGITKEDEKKILKNSESTPEEDSTSDSV